MSSADETRLVLRTPFAIASIMSLVTTIVLLPVWVVVALAAGALGLVQAGRSRSPGEADRADALLALALGCSVGPIVYLLLAGVVAATG